MNNPYIYLEKLSLMDKLLGIIKVTCAQYVGSENKILFKNMKAIKGYREIIRIINHEYFHAIFLRLKLFDAYNMLDNMENISKWWIS